MFSPVSPLRSLGSLPYDYSERREDDADEDRGQDPQNQAAVWRHALRLQAVFSNTKHYLSSDEQSG